MFRLKSIGFAKIATFFYKSKNVEHNFEENFAVSRKVCTFARHYNFEVPYQHRYCITY